MEDFDGFGDPLLSRLMTGDWSAVDEMSEDINQDREIVQEIKEKMLAMKERMLLERTDKELKQDKIALTKARMAMAILGKRTKNRDQLRESGITLQLYRILKKMHTETGKECRQM